jgi:serine phosphatase RsbU (regulator of sigma subunit)
VEPHIAGVGLPARARPDGDLDGLATFTVDATARVATWTVAAARLFGCPARGIVGADVCDALMPGRNLNAQLRQGLARAAAGRVWTATLPAVLAGGGAVAIRCEPLGEAGGGALVIARRMADPTSQGLLSEAAARIGTSLDLIQTAREAVEVTVPGFADGASILVPERMLAADEFAARPDSRETVVRRLGSCLAGQSPADTDRLLRPGEVLVFGSDSPCFQAMSTARPVLFRQLDQGTADRLRRSAGGRRIAAGYSGFLAVPLVARGSVVGCVVFARTAGRPGFGGPDIELAGQLAARAALCIDNARMYHRERRIALALQRGLLPGQPDIPPGLEVAHRHAPAGTSVIGGDWHDIITLSGGRAALIVGDAMGHGPEAAAVMVQLRTAAHTLADLGLDPAEVLRRLDRLAAGMTVAAFATCIFAIVDPADSTCRIAKAGHLPPVLVLADGSTRVLDLPAGLPLGLGIGSFEASPVCLPAGATLALYTDGLVESRVQPLEAGTLAMREMLGTALAAPGATLAGACDLVAQSLQAHGEDDITLVLARSRG